MLGVTVAKPLLPPLANGARILLGRPGQRKKSACASYVLIRSPHLESGALRSIMYYMHISVLHVKLSKIVSTYTNYVQIIALGVEDYRPLELPMKFQLRLLHSAHFGAKACN